MRRKNTSVGKIIFIGVIVVVAALFLIKTIFIKDGNKQFKDYVKDYEDAVMLYAKNDMLNETKQFSYNDLTSILTSKGYLDTTKLDDVDISSNVITVIKENNNISVYNYNNTTTLENRFELSFIKNEKEYICTKTKCS